MSMRTKLMGILVVLALALALPAVSFAADDDVAGNEKAGDALFIDGKPGQTLDQANCHWTCLDGREGEAEVLNLEQCVNACSGACGGQCAPV